MKSNNVVAFFITFVLASCMSTYTQVSTEKIVLTDTVLPPSPTYTPKPTITKSPMLTPTRTQIPTVSFTPLPTPEFGTCPLDLSHPGVEYFGGFTSQHLGVDVVGPHGEPIISPGDCTVIGLFIDGQKNHGIHMECSDYPLNQVDRISIGHIDLAWNNYETLHQYGIPISTFFNDDGTPKIGVENIPPRKNTKFIRGQGTMAFNGNTGDHAMPYHIHINVWALKDNQFISLDPDKYIACK